MATSKDYVDMRPEEWERLPVLAQRIRLLLERDGITLNQLGKALGKSPSVMKSYIEKPVDIGISALEKIADAFSVSTDYLLGRTDCPAVDPDPRAASKYTGLSSRACDSLNQMKGFETNASTNYLHGVLSSLLCDGTLFWRFLLEVWEYKHTITDTLKCLEEDPNSNFPWFLKGAIKSFRYSAIERATECIDNYIDVCTADKIESFNENHPRITVDLKRGDFEVEKIPGQ